jgi:hypothetical protein
MYPEAVAELKKIRSRDATDYSIAQLGRIYALQGRKREALASISQLQHLAEQTYVDPGSIAVIYIALSEKDSAFIWLEKAYEQHSRYLDGLKTNWVYEPIRSDPRYAELVKRVGIP